MGNFKIPPISTLSGTTLTNFFKTIKGQSIAPRYYFKLILTIFIILIASPFHLWEKIYFKNKLPKVKFEVPPVFIIGHWRSGTTFLHNVMCQAPDTAYLTTYQSVFPNNMASKFIFRTFMRIFMPNKRPSDNVKLNIDYPQEDEFAFSNVNPHSYYKFFYFPHNYENIYETSIYHKNLSEEEVKKWFSDYDEILKKAIIETKGSRLIAKNPVNTARIKYLLKSYPDAKFLYIYRNPVTVYLSAERFFTSLFPTLQLQKIDSGFIENMIFVTYKKILNDYLKQKDLIPEKNLYELKFEDFEKL